MQRPVRYRFGSDFAKPVPVKTEPTPEELAPPVPMIELAEHERLLAEAVRNARQDGADEGLQSAEAMAARMQVEALEVLSRQISTALAGADELAKSVEAQAAELARVIGQTIARHALSVYPQAALMAVIEECFVPLRRQAQLTVRVSEDDADSVREQLEAMAEEQGFAGRLVVRGEPGFTRPDVRIEWPEGSMELDHEALMDQINETISTHLGARDQTLE